MSLLSMDAWDTSMGHSEPLRGQDVNDKAMQKCLKYSYMIWHKAKEWLLVQKHYSFYGSRLSESVLGNKMAKAG